MEPTLRISNYIKKEMCSEKEGYLDTYNNEGESVDTFTYLYNQRPDTDTAWDILCSLYNPNHTHNTDYMNHNLDRRIHAVTTMIKQRIEHNYSIQDFADHVNLSISRLEHLFKQQTNISIARYRMWLRIKHYINLFCSNRSLTEAALETGFVDAAHFNRTFKYIVGMIPSTFFQSPKGIEIIVADDY
jgi:AraC-like DNA-binding protein